MAVSVQEKLMDHPPGGCSRMKLLLMCLSTLDVHAQALVAIDVEDLEVDATPEDLMLSYVSGEKGKVIPWAICSPLHD